MRVKYYNWLFDEISTRFGDDRLDPIVLAFGGTNRTIPKTPTTEFVAVCGRDVAEWLCEQRGGERLYIGSRNALDGKRARTARNKRFQAAHLSAGELAAGSGLSVRQVRKIKQNARER